MGSVKLLAVVVLAAALALAPYGSGSGYVAHANGVPYWDLEQNGVPVTTLQVAVGGMFTVDVWIRGILSSDGLTGLYLVVTWDPAMMVLDSYEEASNTHNWDAWHVETIDEDSIDFYAVCGYAGCSSESAVTEDVMLLSLHFKCLGQGSSQVMIRQDAEIGGHLDLLQSGRVDPPAFVVTCKQYSSHAAPVGGTVESINKLAVFAPYLALFGLAAVTMVAAVAPWKKPDN